MNVADVPLSWSADELSVRRILNTWDPIGVHRIGGGWNDDEYDDLILPILTALRHHATIGQIAADLHNTLSADYGLPSPHGCRSAAASFVAIPLMGAPITEEPDQSAVSPREPT